MDNYNQLELLREYSTFLRHEEKSNNTVLKYARDIRAFFSWWGKKQINKEAVLLWKEQLTKNYASSSVNSMLAAVNSFLEWSGLQNCKVKPLKIQREIFAKTERELTQAEYYRLVRVAEKKQNYRLSLLLQTICATGIRVSELCNITVESIKIGRTVVDCKGKTRTVFLPKELCQALCRYCKDEHIDKGVIFKTKNGTPLNRTNIWRDMKSLCESAGVYPSKVFPHNLRHLFARTYYTLEKDLSRLADLLGHSNVSTTRIYTMESGTEHIRQIDRMGLVLAKK